MTAPPNKGMNPTKSSQTDWGLRGLFRCSTDQQTRPESTCDYDGA